MSSKIWTEFASEDNPIACYVWNKNGKNKKLVEIVDYAPKVDSTFPFTAVDDVHWANAEPVISPYVNKFAHVMYEMDALNTALNELTEITSELIKELIDNDIFTIDEIGEKFGIGIRETH